MSRSRPPTAETIALLTRRPDLAGLPFVGALIAQAQVSAA